MNWLKTIWTAFLALLGIKARRVWTALNDVPIYYDDQGRAFFVFPTTKPGANYLLTPAGGPIKGKSITIRYTIDVTGAPVFDYRTHDDNQVEPGFPGIARLMIQRKGDDWSAAGEMQFYRFWSVEGCKELAPGTFEITATLDPYLWTSVYGVRGSDAPAEFAAALAEAESIVLTFGGGYFYGHGVYVHDGAARFTIESISY